MNNSIVKCDICLTEFSPGAAFKNCCPSCLLEAVLEHKNKNLVFPGGMSVLEVAHKQKISPSAVRIIEKKALYKIRKWNQSLGELMEDVIDSSEL